MFNRHLIIQNNNIEYLYLYINNFFEFSKELDKKVSNKRTIQEMINDYLTTNNLDFKGYKVFLVVSGIIISHIILNNNFLNKNKLKDNNSTKIDYIETIDNINIKSDYDNSEVINDLIDKRVLINLPIEKSYR